MKWVNALLALSVLFLLSDVTHAAKVDENLQATRQELLFKDFHLHTMMSSGWNDKVNEVKIQIPSMELDMKLIFTYDKDLIDVNGKPYRYSKPKLVEIFKCKKIPQYLKNTTCVAYETFELTHPGLTIRINNFTVTTMTQTKDFMVAVITGMWKKCCGFTWIMACKVWTRIEHIWIGALEWTSGKVTWFSEKSVIVFTWLSDLTWKGAKFFGELAWNCAERLFEFVWIELHWLAEFTINGAYWFAEMARDEAAELGEMTCDGTIWITEPFVPVFYYIINVAVEFYNGYLHVHVQNVQARFVFLSSWQDGAYWTFASLVVNLACLVVYRLVSRTAIFMTCFIGRKWQEYKDRRAAANLPPKPKRPIWQNRQRKKKKKNDKW